MNALKLLIAICVLTFPVVSFADSPNYWKSGLLIGSISGAVAGGAISGVAAHRLNNDDGCVGSCFSNGSKVGLVLGVTAGGAAVGGGLGALIGLMIKKKEPTSTLSPQVSPDGQNFGVVYQSQF